MTAVLWVCVITGAAVWGAVIAFALYALLIEGSGYLTYGCGFCDWEASEPRRKPWWMLRLAFRWHRGRIHGLWTQRAGRREYEARRTAERERIEPRAGEGFPR